MKSLNHSSVVRGTVFFLPSLFMGLIPGFAGTPSVLYDLAVADGSIVPSDDD